MHIKNLCRQTEALTVWLQLIVGYIIVGFSGTEIYWLQTRIPISKTYVHLIAWRKYLKVTIMCGLCAVTKVQYFLRFS